jgi:hypothetical protein
MGCVGPRQIAHKRPQIGERVGQLKVIGYKKHAFGRATGVVVQCDCGSPPMTKPFLELRRAKFQRCNVCVLNMPYGEQPDGSSNIRPFARKFTIPKVGDIIGTRKVLEVELGPGGGFLSMLLQCECGARPLKVKTLTSFNRNKGNSCRRCARGLVVNNRLRDAGFPQITTRSPQYIRLRSILDGAIARCHSPKSSAWKNYGGRARNPISVYAAWREDKVAAILYFLTLPNWDVAGFELDRADNNKGYEPGNLRFVDIQTNSKNRRTIQTLDLEAARLLEENAELKARIRQLESAGD